MKTKLFIYSILIFSVATFANDLIGKQAPDFKLKDINGKEIQLSDYRGKIILLDFWASWCAPCKVEFPFLINFYKKNKKEDFIIIAINIDNHKSNMRRFLNEHYSSNIFPVIFDSEKTIPPLYNLNAMPTSVFINKKGIISYIHTGFKESSKMQFKQELTTLLRNKKEL